MEVPIFENEAPVGTMQIVSQGLYTVFQTRLPAGGDAGTDSIRPQVVAEAEPSERLMAASAGKRVGVSCADHSEFRTPNSEFSLTRLWLVGKCGAAAPLGLMRQEEDGRSFCRKLSRRECQGLPKNPVRVLVLPNGKKPGDPAGSGNGSSRTPTPTENTENSQLQIPNSESVWLPLSDGSLIDPARRLLALPWRGGAVAAPARKISLGEREYLLFRY